VPIVQDSRNLGTAKLSQPLLQVPKCAGADGVAQSNSRRLGPPTDGPVAAAKHPSYLYKLSSEAWASVQIFPGIELQYAWSVDDGGCMTGCLVMQKIMTPHAGAVIPHCILCMAPGFHQRYWTLRRPGKQAAVNYAGLAVGFRFS